VAVAEEIGERLGGEYDDVKRRRGNILYVLFNLPPIPRSVDGYHQEEVAVGNFISMQSALVSRSLKGVKIKGQTSRHVHLWGLPVSSEVRLTCRIFCQAAGCRAMFESSAAELLPPALSPEALMKPEVRDIRLARFLCDSYS
jgi:hypothetical protein